MKKKMKKVKKQWVVVAISSLSMIAGLQAATTSADQVQTSSQIEAVGSQNQLSANPQLSETPTLKSQADQSVSMTNTPGTAQNELISESGQVSNAEVSGSIKEILPTLEESNRVEKAETSLNLKSINATSNQMIKAQVVSSGVISQPTIRYESHISSIGWQATVKNGALSGTTGRSKAIEAVRITVDNPTDGNITYSSHLAGIGWQKAVLEGNISGTTGQSRQMEAIKINVTGNLALIYDVYYRAHIADYGWLSWAKNGESAGSQGLAKRLEALEIQLIKKGDQVSFDTKRAFVIFTKPLLSYQANMMGTGWQTSVSEGLTAGFIENNTSNEILEAAIEPTNPTIVNPLNQPKQIQAFVLNLNQKEFGDISYRAHVQNIGWQNFSTSSQLAGSLTNNNRLEAIQFKLSGLLDSQYDLKYRAYVQNQGWQNWVYDNYISGTTGQSLGITALEVQLVAKSKGPIAFFQNENSYAGMADVYVASGANGKRINKVRVAAWSASDQSNLKWYEAKASSDGVARISFNQINHKNMIGNYIVHAYAYLSDGSVQKIVVGNSNFNALVTPYYNQKDPRWASKRYGQFYLGPTGCVPTSLAMIFSSLSGKAILPPQVADYLYTKTNEFDKDGPGTTNKGILAAVANFGYKATNLGSQSAITAALQAGYHVACAIQYNQFVIHGSHEMVLKGYSNGATYVYDPYTKELCGWYSIANLWREQSLQEGDRIGIPAPFYKITSL